MVNTTKTVPFGDTGAVEDNRAKKKKVKVDLTKCLKCAKKITAFVASEDGKFCNDECMSVYYAD